MWTPKSLLDLIEASKSPWPAASLRSGSALWARSKKIPGAGKCTRDVQVACGGTAPPEAMIRSLDKYGFHLTHLWGMTETTPLATTGGIRGHMRDWSEDEKYRVRASQGWPAPIDRVARAC